MANPTIVNSDTSDMLCFDGVFRDKTVTVATGEVLAKYTVLALDTTNNTVIACDSTGEDGEDDPCFILMEELDNSAGGTATAFANTQVMVKGEFDSANITFDNGTDTLATLTAADISMANAMTAKGLIPTVRAVEDILDNQ